MRKLILLSVALCAAGALFEAEEERQGRDANMAPFLAAFAIEMGIFLLRRHQGGLLAMKGGNHE